MKYIGNCADKIAWNEVIKLCQESVTGDRNTVVSVVERSEVNLQNREPMQAKVLLSVAEQIANEQLLQEYRKVIGDWRDAGCDLDKIYWYDYYPGDHYPESISDTFAAILGIRPLRVFVSEVYPGITVPYHWDVEDKGPEWLKKYGMLYRYTCCIDAPRVGSVLIVDDHCLYDFKQGDIFEWDSYRNYHSAANGGEPIQYYFHMLGYKIKC
jgi:hypothetical protein